MIQGINGLQSYTYNKIQNDLYVTRNNISDGQEAVKKEEQQQQQVSRDLDLRLGDIKPRKNASLEDISLSLKEPASFEMKGRDSEIESLDIEKAVSDMQKDQALMQYQYFVGETNVMNNEDGIVIQK